MNRNERDAALRAIKWGLAGLLGIGLAGALSKPAKLTPAQKQALWERAKREFDTFAINGKITRDRFASLWQTNTNPLLRLTPAQVTEAFDKIDADKDGGVTWPEFSGQLEKMLENA